MLPLINGIIQTKNGYAIKNFMQPDQPPIEIGKLTFPTYPAAIHYLSNLLYPESYRPYLLAVEAQTPDEDTWNNLVFTGHIAGVYNHESQQFQTARQLNMHAAEGTETAYVEALAATYESIKTMVPD